MSTEKQRRAVGIPVTVLIEHDRAQMRARGLDPKMIPDEPFHILRPAAIAKRYGFSLATLYRRFESGELPRPITLGGTEAA
jgi:predicted DNA-binding transcriptional regulator AlpA